MDFLEDLDMVPHEVVNWVSHWKLTHQGQASIEVSSCLASPCLALSVRSACEQQDMITFELLCTLRSHGWVPMVRAPRRCKDGSGRPFPQLVDYRHGAAPEYWIHPKHRTINRLYVLALLRAEDLKVPLKHLQPEAYCAALLEGRPYLPEWKGDPLR